MKINANGKQYNLHGWMPESDYQILGHLVSCYYLCQDKAGDRFALYLPNLNEYYPRVG